MTVTITKVRQDTLPHGGSSGLLGFAPDGTPYIEEFYADAYLAQHIIAPDGTFLHTTDEQHGRAALKPLAVPPEATIPTIPPPDALEFYAGAPLRGLRAEDRIDSLVFPLEMPDKMRLVEQLRLDVLPPALIGLSESRVLSTAAVSDELLIVCRRVRFPHALMTERDGMNYDTITCHLLQQLPSDAPEDPLYTDGITRDDSLSQPHQCAIQGRMLVVADVGAVHVYQIQTA